MPARWHTAFPRVLLSAAAFLGSFLLFQLELMTGSAVLPLFGGGYYVWTVCLLFYQTVLVAGYAYALLLSERLPGRRLLSLHLGLLLAALLLTGWHFPAARFAVPVPDLLWRLTLYIGAPFFLLSASTTLCHRLLSESATARSYTVFAWSNAGSLAGMLSYALLVEPAFARPQADALWLGLFAAYFLLLLAARSAVSFGEDPPPRPADSQEKPRWGVWLALPAATSALLAAVTSYQSAATASMPLTWIIPLSAYLFSYALLFSGHEFGTGALRFFLFGLLGALLVLLWRLQAPVSTAMAALLDWALLFVCVAAHRELYEARPLDPALAPRFYLAMGLGGALGTALVTPAGALRFGYGFADLYIAAALLIGAMSYAAGARKGLGGRAALASLLLLAVIILGGARISGESAVYALRNFYGMYRVEDDKTLGLRRFVNGATVHGVQYLGTRRDRTTAYYSNGSPISEVLDDFPARRVGAVGLGVGVSCADAKPGTDWTFYELDPDVEMIARKYFTFLADCRARVRVITGDARLNLAKTPPGSYGLLYLDAFTGGAVPFHLITREALELYKSRLRPGGLMVFHVSANFLDITPVIALSASAAGLSSLYKEVSFDPSDPSRLSSEWLAVSSNPAYLSRLRAEGWTPPERRPGLRAWSDDYRDVLQVLKL